MRNFVSVEDQERSREPDPAALKSARALKDPDAEIVYKALAARGSVLSMINLGHLYEFRSEKYGGADLSESEKWYRRAMDSGSALATFHCGDFYFRRAQYAEAKGAFTLGVDRSYAPSILRLANLYIKGYGVDQDFNRARSLLMRSSQLGNLWAERALSRMDFNAGRNSLIKIRGLIFWVISDVRFLIYKQKNPNGERLKK